MVWPATPIIMTPQAQALWRMLETDGLLHELAMRLLRQRTAAELGVRPEELEKLRQTVWAVEIEPHRGPGPQLPKPTW